MALSYDCSVINQPKLQLAVEYLLNLNDIVLPKKKRRKPWKGAAMIHSIQNLRNSLLGRILVQMNSSFGSNNMK